MASSSEGSSFLASHGKKYDPTFEWNDDDGLLQDPRTQGAFFFGFFAWKNVVACFIESFTVRYCHLVILKFWGHCVIDRVWKYWLWRILEVCFFGVQFGQCWWLLEF